MTDTAYGDISQRTAAYAATEMLSHAEPILCLSKFAQSKPLPKNKADNVKFRRPVPFDAATTALTEGVTPTAQAMVYEDVSAAILQYGAVINITDKVEDLAEDPVLSDASMLSGEQAAETVEILTWNKIKATTNVFFSNDDGTPLRTELDTTITIAKQRKITRALKANKAKKVTSMVGASPNYSTFPVDAAYIAFGHTDLEADIRALPDFTPVEQYGSLKALPYEVGKCEDVRYILTPTLEPYQNAGAAIGAGMVSTAGVNNDVYPIMYIGKESYGLVPLKGSNSIKPSVINPGTISKSDPLGQMGHVGWKTWFTAVILNDGWLACLECCATDL